MKTKKRYYRIIKSRQIGLTTFSGNVEKTGSQFQNKWAIYRLTVVNDDDNKTYTADITKIYRLWINNKDSATTSDIDSQIQHCLRRFSTMVPLSAETRKNRLKTQ
jgi:hypothetical protein